MAQQPMDMLPPELQAEQEALLRRQRVADMMTQRGQIPIQGGMAGRAYVGPSWTQGLAQLANAYVGGKTSDDIGVAKKNIAGRYNDMYADEVARLSAMRSGSTPRPSAVDPQEMEQAADQGTALPGPVQDVAPASRQQMIDAYLSSKMPEFRDIGRKQAAQEPMMVMKEQEGAENRAERLQERILALDAAAQNAALSREERAARAAEAAALRRDLQQNQFAQQRSMAQLAAGLRQGAANNPKAPTGFRYKEDGSLEPIPGGPKDMSAKNNAVAESMAIKSKIVTDKVDEALGMIGPMTTGLIGDLRSTTIGRMTGSGAYDLEKTLDTIKANIGFNELQAMRQMSPTGGALGQVAVRELDMLQAVLSSLDKGQDPELLKKNLLAVKNHYANWKKAVDTAAAQEGGVSGTKTGSNDVQTFASEAAAAAAGLKPGTKVIINGVKGTWQ